MNTKTNHWCPTCGRHWGHDNCNVLDSGAPTTAECHNCIDGGEIYATRVEIDGPMWYRDEFLEMIWEVQDANKNS